MLCICRSEGVKYCGTCGVCSLLQQLPSAAPRRSARLSALRSASARRGPPLSDCCCGGCPNQRAAGHSEEPLVLALSLYAHCTRPRREKCGGREEQRRRSCRGRATGLPRLAFAHINFWEPLHNQMLRAHTRYQFGIFSEYEYHNEEMSCCHC